MSDKIVFEFLDCQNLNYKYWLGAWDKEYVQNT